MQDDFCWRSGMLKKVIFCTYRSLKGHQCSQKAMQSFKVSLLKKPSYIIFSVKRFEVKSKISINQIEFLLFVIQQKIQ